METLLSINRLSMIYYTTGKGRGKFSTIGEEVDVAVETIANNLLQRGIISDKPIKGNEDKIEVQTTIPIDSESLYVKPQRGRQRK
jgi:hypothetical protein